MLPPGARPSLPAGCFGSRILEASTLTITTSLGLLTFSLCTKQILICARSALEQLRAERDRGLFCSINSTLSAFHYLAYLGKQPHLADASWWGCPVILHIAWTISVTSFPKESKTIRNTPPLLGSTATCLVCSVMVKYVECTDVMFFQRNTRMWNSSQRFLQARKVASGLMDSTNARRKFQIGGAKWMTSMSGRISNLRTLHKAWLEKTLHRKKIPSANNAHATDLLVMWGVSYSFLHATHWNNTCAHTNS